MIDPFDPGDQVNNAFVSKCLYTNGIPAKTAFYRHVFLHVFHDHAVVFTHGDLSEKKKHYSQSIEELVLLDWESAG